MEAAPIGPMPSTSGRCRGRPGAACCRRPSSAPSWSASSRTRPSTTNGRAGLPSGGLGRRAAGCPSAAPRQRQTIDETACATPAVASSRYLATNSLRLQPQRRVVVVDPNGTVTVHGPDVDLGAAVEVRALPLRWTAPRRDRDGDVAEPGVDRDARGDARVGRHLVVERVEEDDPVRAEVNLAQARPKSADTITSTPAITASEVEREVGAALDRRCADRWTTAGRGAAPAGSRRGGSRGGSRRWSSTNFAAVRSAEPDDEREAAGQPDVA